MVASCVFSISLLDITNGSVVHELLHTKIIQKRKEFPSGGLLSEEKEKSSLAVVYLF
jgi:hypothetical protein